ncbi:unnamed protein product [Ectocarpus sp. CCAP 1310/34]|nr:unnamed protein product [Ectocarpus sp. CCAP 1310/34]
MPTLALPATAPLKPKTAHRAACKRIIEAGKTPTRAGVNFTAAERGKNKSTNEGKADRGKADLQEGQKAARGTISGKKGDVQQRKNKGRGGETAHERGGGSKKADVTLSRVTQVDKVTPEQARFNHYRCSFVDPSTGANAARSSCGTRESSRTLGPAARVSGLPAWIPTSPGRTECGCTVRPSSRGGRPGRRSTTGSAWSESRGSSTCRPNLLPLP